MKKTERIKKEFKSEVEKCLLLDEADKKYWLENAENISPDVLESVYNVVKNKNDLMSKYISTALANDPNHEILAELKQKIKSIRSGSLKLAEKEEQPDAEKMLAEKLAKL